LFGPQLNDDLCLLADFEVNLFESGLPTVRVPDLLVALDAAGENNPTRLTPDEVLLVVEVIWPGSRRTDRVAKRSEYAEAGIPNYWIVDTERPVTITAFELVEREYKLVAETSTTLSVTVPVPLTVDVRALLP
jgi:Uma2 family endonuclease